jgi:putative SOS response-associated peptidase YedK
MFRENFRSQRCLILAHGFYDSLDMGAYRQPWHIHLKGDDLMAFAGVYESGAHGEAFAIISAPANAVVARVIDRMPVILPQDTWRRWLAAETNAPALKALLTPYPAELMEAWPVTRKVNQRGYDVPDCIDPVIPDQGELPLF